MATQQVPGRGSVSRLRLWAIVVGVVTLLAGAAAVASVAVAGQTSAAHVGGPTPSVVSTPAPSAITNRIPDPTGAPPVKGIEQTPTAPRPPTPSSTPTTTAPPHFDTPQAAMMYLAAAWNAHDAIALRHVTNPASRAELDAMHSEAVNLRLDHCDARPLGDYVCYFRHDYPSGTSTTVSSYGQAVFLVGPALIPGWYMTVVQSCG